MFNLSHSSCFANSFLLSLRESSRFTTKSPSFLSFIFRWFKVKSGRYFLPSTFTKSFWLFSFIIIVLIIGGSYDRSPWFFSWLPGYLILFGQSSFGWFNSFSHNFHMSDVLSSSSCGGHIFDIWSTSRMYFFTLSRKYLIFTSLGILGLLRCKYLSVLLLMIILL